MTTVADDLDPAAVERAARAYTAAGTADFDGMSAHAQERLLTRMRAALAAAGLLVTPDRPGDVVTSDWDTWVAEHDAQVAARAREEALTVAAAWIERLYPAGLVGRAWVLADLHEWAERASRGVAPSGRPYDRIERQEGER